MTVQAIDPIAREVVHNRLVSIVREMSHSLARAAYSPIIYEVKDFSNVLLRTNAELVAQAEGIPVFLGAMSPVLDAVLARHPLETMRPGDVFVSNDPYLGNGTHKNDVDVLRPIFDGDRPILFAVSKAHWTDIGGKDPGSWSPDARNTFQEGLTIPPLRIVAEGRMDRGLLDLILANTREAEDNEGDLLAQIGACNVADARVQELLRTWSWEELDAYVASLMDHAEAEARAEIERIPDGVYEGEDWVDSDGVREEPFPVRVRVTVSGSEMELDFTGCPPQRDGACGNATWVSSGAAARVAFTCATVPHAVTNAGTYRPLTVRTRPGTILHPLPPAPVTCWGDVGRAIIEAVLRAIGRADPGRGIAGFYGNVDAMAVTGTDPGDGRSWIHFSPYAGGWGARHDHDGVNALCPIINGDNANVPAEVVEHRYPLRVEQYALVPDSGGAGRTRGGLGVRLDLRVLEADATLSGSLDRYALSPPGVDGGGDGGRSGLWVIGTEGGERPAHKCAGLPVAAGEVISHRTGGGGGWGDPRERDRALVEADVRDGYVSPAAARELYGAEVGDAG